MECKNEQNTGRDTELILSIKVLDKKEQTLCVSQGREEVSLVCTREYEEGDKISIETSQEMQYLVIQMDDALGESFVYKTDTILYKIPFGEKRICYSPKAFSGQKHLITARVAREWEIHAYKNLAQNRNDQPGEAMCYPHATANVETRGEAVFAARNAIDGVCENHSHGEWPYGSWGINRQVDARMRIKFGRPVLADRARLYLRADFPHDNWWEQVTLEFSDGTSLDWELDKTDKAQVITFAPRTITWVELSNLKKAEDASPFPALTQLEIYGKEAFI